MERRKASSLRPVLEAESGNGAKGAIVWSQHPHRAAPHAPAMSKGSAPSGFPRRSSSARMAPYRRAVALLQARTSVAAKRPSTAAPKVARLRRLATAYRSSASVTAERQMRSAPGPREAGDDVRLSFKNQLAVLVSSMKRVTRLIPTRDRALVRPVGARPDSGNHPGPCLGRARRKAIEGTGLGRQDHIADCGIAADIDLVAIAAKGGGKSHRLAMSVLE